MFQLRLSAHDKNGRLLRNTKFQIRSEGGSLLNPSSAGGFSTRPEDFHFALRPEPNGRATTLHSKRRLAGGTNYRLVIRSSSNTKSGDDGPLKWQSNFLVLISVSKNGF
jgi:hypothetical protein